MSNLKVKKLNPNAIIPTKNKKTDVGLDIYALEDCFITQGSSAVVKTGIAICIEEGYVGKIEDRSGMAIKGLRTGAGVIDPGYSGEVGVVLHNLTCTLDSYDFPEDYSSFNLKPDVFSERKEFGYKIKKGDRIAQILVYKVQVSEAEEVQELWDSERGSRGYGSSGK